MSASAASVHGMTKSTATAPVLGVRALNRATLSRQLLLRRSPLTVQAAVGHLLGLQAQNVKPPYYALAARLEGFVPEQLSTPMADRLAVEVGWAAWPRGRACTRRNTSRPVPPVMRRVCLPDS